MSLAIDGSVTTTAWSSSSSKTVNLTTTSANDIIVVAISIEKAPPTLSISSVTATGLTFVRRASSVESVATAAHCTVETWWAYSTGALSSLAITITASASIDDGTICAFGVSGCSATSAPWDTNASLPDAVDAGLSSGTLSTTISTDSTDTMVLRVCGSYNNASVNTPTGWTRLCSIVNAGGINFSFLCVDYKVFSAALSSSTISSGSGSNYLCYLVDAIRQNAAAALTARPVVFVCT
jgi:hypothetical protein